MKNILLRRAIYLISVVMIVSSFLLAADTPEKKGKDLININTASVEELIKLPGIGQALAKRIVDFRSENGPFKRVEDLMKVKGIGEKNFQKLKDLITVGKESKE
ncbi:MAG: helix-hairpin-helix domain-containing protein [Acidobacteriota bacterium]